MRPGRPRTAFAHGYSLTLSPPLDRAEDWYRIGADGVVLCDPVTADPRIDHLHALRLPTVSIDRDPDRPNWCTYVAGDNEQNTLDLLDHLSAQGATKIAMLAVEASWAWNLDSTRAYERWCAAPGTAPRLVRLALSRQSPESFDATTELLASADPPDAVLVTAEQFIEGALRACRARDLRVPDDVLLAVGNDSRVAQLSDPPITAVDLRPEQQAKAAIDMLLRLLDGEKVTEPTIVASTLHVRASTTPRYRG